MIFTAMPIILFCLFDFEHTKDKFLAEPRLYSKAFTHPRISASTVLGWISLALFHGTIVWVLCNIVFQTSLSQAGMTTGLLEQGNLCMIGVISAVTFQILFDSHTINLIIILFAFLSVGSYFLCSYLMGLFSFFPLYGMFLETNSFEVQWPILLLCSFCMYPLTKLWSELSRIFEEEVEEEEEELRRSVLQQQVQAKSMLESKFDVIEESKDESVDEESQLSRQDESHMLISNKSAKNLFYP